MGKRETDYPHTISFRVTDQTWRRIQKQIEGSNLTPHEWCRKAALDRIDAANFKFAACARRGVTCQINQVQSTSVRFMVRHVSNN